MKVLDNGGRRLAWWSKRSVASKNAIPVVFLHAYPLASSMWRSQVALCEAGIEVYAYDLYGFGKSSAPDAPEGYSIEGLVADLHAFLDEIVRRPAVVCGLSLGGYVALQAGLGGHKLIAGLILADVGAGGDAPQAFRDEVLAWADAYEISGFDAYLNLLFQDPLFGDSQMLGAQIAESMVGTMRANAPAGVINTARRVIASRATVYALGDRIRNIRAPTLVMVGAGDEKCVKPANFLHASINNSKLEVFEGCGHFINIEQAERFNFLIDRFAHSTHLQIE